MSITLTDLNARMQAVKSAPMLLKPAAAEVALNDFLKYLAELEERITNIEKGAQHGNR